MMMAPSEVMAECGNPTRARVVAWVADVAERRPVVSSCTRSDRAWSIRDGTSAGISSCILSFQVADTTDTKGG